jgi:hypothetical protein
MVPICLTSSGNRLAESWVQDAPAKLRGYPPAGGSAVSTLHPQGGNPAGVQFGSRSQPRRA